MIFTWSLNADHSPMTSTEVPEFSDHGVKYIENINLANKVERLGWQSRSSPLDGQGSSWQRGLVIIDQLCNEREALLCSQYNVHWQLSQKIIGYSAKGNGGR
jgi:hypothetical protein